MTHITIMLEEPTFKTLLLYYWRQLPTHEYAMVFTGVLLLQGLAEIFAVTRLFRLASHRHPYWPVNIILVLAFSCSGCVATYALLSADSPRLVSYWVGLGVFICAYIGRELTHSRLNWKYASSLEMVIHEKNVITGVFALIRYPLATLYLVEMAVFLLIAQNLLSAFLFLIACLGVLWKIHHEERRFISQFSDRFAAYRRTTKRIIPFIY